MGGAVAGSNCPCHTAIDVCGSLVFPFNNGRFSYWPLLVCALCYISDRSFHGFVAVGLVQEGYPAFDNSCCNNVTFGDQFQPNMESEKL